MCVCVCVCVCSHPALLSRAEYDTRSTVKLRKACLNLVISSS